MNWTILPCQTKSDRVFERTLFPINMQSAVPSTGEKHTDFSCFFRQFMMMVYEVPCMIQRWTNEDDENDDENVDENDDVSMMWCCQIFEKNRVLISFRR